MTSERKRKRTAPGCFKLNFYNRLTRIFCPARAAVSFAADIRLAAISKYPALPQIKKSRPPPPRRKIFLSFLSKGLSFSRSSCNSNECSRSWFFKSSTNHFKMGGRDKYELMTEVPVSKGTASINVKKLPSKFYKVAIEMPYNFLNRWIVVRQWTVNSEQCTMKNGQWIMWIWWMF